MSPDDAARSEPRRKKPKAPKAKKVDFDHARLGRNIKALREGLGYEQAEFARMIGAEGTQLAHWEKGKYADMQIRNFLTIAARLPCRLDDLTDGVSTEYVPTTKPTLQVGTKGDTIAPPTRDPARGTDTDGRIQRSRRTVIDLRAELQRHIKDAEQRTRELLRVSARMGELAIEPGILDEPPLAGTKPPARPGNTRRNRR